MPQILNSEMCLSLTLFLDSSMNHPLTVVATKVHQPSSYNGSISVLIGNKNNLEINSIGS